MLKYTIIYSPEQRSSPFSLLIFSVSLTLDSQLFSAQQTNPTKLRKRYAISTIR